MDSIPSDILEAYNAGRIPADISLSFLAQSKDRGAEIGIWFVLSLATLIFALRLLVRLVIRPSPGLDDLLASITLLCYIAFAVLCQILLNLGSARHFDYIQYVLPLDTIEQTEVLDYAAHCVYTSALYSCRISGLAFYHSRIIGRSKSFTWTIRAVALVLTLAYIPQMLLIILHCMPVTGLWPYDWQHGADEYSCLQWGTVYATNSAVSLLSDLLLFSIPVAIIFSLKRLSHSKRVKLAAVLMPGIAVVAISITRLVLVIQGQWEADESWYYAPLLAIESAEIGLTLIALSAPALHPLFRSWSHKAGRKLSVARGSGQSGSKGSGNAGHRDGYYGNRSNIAWRWWTNARMAESDDEDEAADGRHRLHSPESLSLAKRGRSRAYGDPGPGHGEEVQVDEEAELVAPTEQPLKSRGMA